MTEGQRCSAIQVCSPSNIWKKSAASVFKYKKYLYAPPWEICDP